MKNKIIIKVMILILLNISIIASTLSQVDLTQAEKDFIKTHPKIVLGTGDSWAPYSIKSEDGTIIGYDQDILNKINKATGANFVLKQGNWIDIQKQAKEKKIDGLATAIVTKEREEYLNFSNIYSSAKKMVLVKHRNPLAIYSENDLVGKTIAVHKGNVSDTNNALQIRNAKIIYTDTPLDALKEVMYRKADVTFGNISIFYILNQDGIHSIDNAFTLANSLDVTFSVRKDWGEAIGILNKGLSTISDNEKVQLKQKWFRGINKNSKTQLSKNELIYLKNIKEITMCIDPNWMPFEMFNDKGKHVGLTADYYDIFQKELGINIKVIQTNTWSESLEYAKDRKCDILSLAMPTPQRKEYLNFTSPYLKIPLVIVTNQDITYINDIANIQNEKLGIIKGYAFVEILKNKYPNINVVEVDSIQDGFDNVRDGKLFGFIGTLASVGHNFQKGYGSGLKITSKLDDTWELGVGVRNDDKILLNIFEKIISNLDKKEQQKILNDWVPIEYVKGTDYTLVWQIIIVFICVLFIVLFYYVKQKKLKDLIEEEKENFEAIYNGTKEAIAILDMDTNFIKVNPSYMQITGFSEEELLNTSCLKLTAQKDIEATKNALKTFTAIGLVENFEKECIVKDGRTILVNMSMTLLHNPDRILVSARDITLAKKEEFKISTKAYIDTLTQVYNRNKFDEIFELQLKETKRYNDYLSIAILDIDKFKDFNDKYGHFIGDEVLTMMAQLVNSSVRETDVFARWGGEEFIILFKNTPANIAKEVSEKLKNKIEENEHQTAGKITASFGVTEYKDGDTLESIFKRCDKALYKAKENGRNRVEVL